MTTRRTIVRITLTAGAILLAAGATPAHAQSLRPNILFLFDTSGSMHQDSNLVDREDGTSVCPLNTTNPTSRIFSLKSGIRQALQEVGTDEANFGLMSFPETVSNTYTALNQTQCTDQGQQTIGHYAATGAQNITVPNRANNGNHSATNYPIGCLMTTDNTAGPTAYGSWFTSGASQVFEVGVTAAAPGTIPSTAQFDPSGAAQMAAIYKWIDNVEAPTSNGAVTNPELHPKEDTPLGRSLFYANTYFANEIVPKDPKGSCRHNVIVIVTDGDDTCDDATAPDGNFNLTTCSGGAAFDYFNPINQACLLNKMGVKVYVITDTTADNANDAIAKAGGTAASIRVSLNDANAAKSAIVGVIAQNVPPAEICNGKDDNCNALIDEGVSNQCSLCTPGNNIAACGSFVISPNNPNDPDNVVGQNGGTPRHCQVETCNCIDDNCNGQVDEGLPPNACGGPCGCAVPPEICDGLDNNCDGIIDNGNWPTGPVGATCNNGLIGACNRIGHLICNAAGTDTVCNAGQGTPQQEICNGIDDNCDGQIDNPPAGGNLPGVGEACGNGLGACQAGTIICQNGKLVCNVTSMPQPEICDGIDNDCDGIVDDGNFPETGQACLCPGLTQAEVDSGGICKAGHLQCMGKLGFVCVGCVLPTAGEVCNGKDNNCDGVLDKGGTCPNGYNCKDGACALQCTGGEFPCPLGYKCQSAYCIPQRCAGVTCMAGQQCDESSGSCVSLCQGVTCSNPYAMCVNGQCIDCNTLGCPSGQLCLGGQCQQNPCQNITCAAGQYCSAGTCVDLCDPSKCASGQRCVAGNCIADPCNGKLCPSGQFCNPNTAACEQNKCLATQCGPGQTCVSATDTCVTDPCLTINCPSDCWTCGVTVDGKGTCMLKDSCQPVSISVGQKGGGESGCSCAVGGGDAPSWTILLVGLGLLLGRRRPRR